MQAEVYFPTMGLESVIGLGVDIIEVERIARDLSEPMFVQEFCSEDEIAYCDRLKGPLRAMCYAARFSAKEAVIKALDEPGLNWREIIIRRRESGQPYVELTGGARNRAEELGVSSLYLSFAHIKSITIAFCVAEGNPPSLDMGRA